MPSENRARAYCITINNPHREEEKLLALPFKYLIFQYEEGEAGTPHIQAYVHFESSVAFSTVKKGLPTAHIEAAKGTPASNVAYCSKEEGRIAGPYEHGERPFMGKRTDLQEISLMLQAGASVRDVLCVNNHKHVRHIQYVNIIDNLLGNPKDRSEETDVYIYWGASGTGKTRKVFDDYKSVYKCLYNKGVKWFNGYTRQDCILLDDWPFELDPETYHFLLDLTDRYPSQQQTKGGFITINKSSVVLTSNASPCNWFKGAGLQSLTRRVKQIVHFGCTNVGPCQHDVLFNNL